MKSANHSAWIAGVGMTPFVKPSAEALYTDLARVAIQDALSDAGLEYADLQQVYAGYVYGDSASGQRAVYGVERTGIPVINVNNNCSTGSTALYLARQAIEGGAAECVLAVGFEQMRRGALGELYDDRPGPLALFAAEADRCHGASDAPLAIRLFGGAARDHASRYGTRPETFARIAVKARQHAAANPRAVFRSPITEQEVLSSPEVFAPLTRLQCCPPTCGAAAAVLVSRDFALRHGLSVQVRIVAQAMVTDTSATFGHDMIAAVGGPMTAMAAKQVYEIAGIGPKDISVVELHDCFTSNEIISYEGLGLVEEGGAEKMVVDGDNTYGGRYVVNPSGGLLAKGHPLGATGLAQCFELVDQLRGRAGARQVQRARLALQHNIGIGGACVVTVYERMRV